MIPSRIREPHRGVTLDSHSSPRPHHRGTSSANLPLGLVLPCFLWDCPLRHAPWQCRVHFVCQKAGPLIPFDNSSAGAHPSNHAGSIESLNSERYYYHSFLEKLLGLIATGENETVSRVVSVIRSGASHREILNMIEEVSASQGTTGGGGGGESNGTINLGQ